MDFVKINRVITQLRMITIRNGWKKAEYLKKKNMFHSIGEHCFYQSTILPAEPYLVSLHNNVAISAGVRLITHSAAHVVFDYQDKTDKYLCRHGKIEIHDNVYIGADVIINMGVTIIVTKDVPPGSVVAGVPARVIGSYEDAKKKHLAYCEPYLEKGLREPCTVAEMTEYFPIEFDD